METDLQPPYRTLTDFSSMILIAAPHQTDISFSRTAVLIVEHSKEGAFGLIVNRPMDLTLDKVASGLDTRWGGRLPAPRVYQGGPVMPESAWLLHSKDEITTASRLVADDLALTAEPETICGLLGRPAGRFRIYLGYAGWAEDQLNAEIAAGCWIIAPVTLDAVFSDEPADVWPGMLAQIGIDPGMWCNTSSSRH